MVRSLALAAVALLAACHGSAAEPGVTVSMVLQGGGVYSTVVAFPGVVPRDKAMAALQDLAGRGGWKPQRVEFRNAPAVSGVPAQTFLAFYVADPFPGGVLPVEPFVLAFKPWKRLHLVIAHQGTLTYAGPPAFDSAGLTVRFSASGSALNLQTEVRDPNLRRVELPNDMTRSRPAATEGKAAAPRPVPHPWWFWPAFAFAGALLAWGVAYGTMVTLTRRPR